MACRLDLLLGVTYIKDTAVIAFCVNETLSIAENAGLMGVPMPKVVTEALELLQKSQKTEAEKNA